jgi:hypothetical protein
MSSLARGMASAASMRRGRREGSVAKFLEHTTCRNTEELKLQHTVYNKMLRPICDRAGFLLAYSPIPKLGRARSLFNDGQHNSPIHAPTI